VILYRAVLYLVVVGTAFAGVLALGSSALDAYAIESPPTRIGVASLFRRRLDRIRRLDLPVETRRVVFLGDSMEADFPPLQKVPVVLQREITARTGGEPPIRVFDLAIVGTGIFDYFCLADLLAQAQPHLVVLPFNLSNPSRHWQRSFSRPELAGWIDAARIPAALRLPLSWAGLSTDELFYYRAIVGSGGFDAWVRRAGEKLRYTEAKRLLAGRIARRSASGESPEEVLETARYLLKRKRTVDSEARRLTPAGVRHYFGPSLDGLGPSDPSLRLLGGTVRALRAHGIDVLVYVDPVNVEHMRKLGLGDPQRLAETIASLRAVVQESGGYFRDLHELFPDEFFRDEIGHLTFDAVRDGPARLSAELAPSVIELSGAHAL
jgi:hypothetical protein